MRTLLALLFSLISSTAFATVDAWPALYNVRDVAQTDQLNIRAEPGASAPIVGSFAWNRQDIEVIRLNDAETWGLVNVGERTGWVSMRYMYRQPNQYVGALPSIASCFGTEPFWSLDFSPGGLVLDQLGLPGQSFPPVIAHQPMQRPGTVVYDTGDFTGFLRSESCNDGMSDQEYGLSITFIVGRGVAAQTQYGCCTLQPR